MRRKEEPYSRAMSVVDASILVSAMEEQSGAEVSITISGALDAKIKSAASVELYVSESNGRPLLGGALGISSGVLLLGAQLSERAFGALLNLVIAGRLNQVQLVLGPVLRGKGNLRSILFSSKSSD